MKVYNNVYKGFFCHTNVTHLENVITLSEVRKEMFMNKSWQIDFWWEVYISNVEASYHILLVANFFQH